MNVSRHSIAIPALAALALLAGCTGQQALNTLTPTRGYDVATNIVYDDATGQRLDIYSPDGVRHAPVVVFFFGSRWSEGAGAGKDNYKFVGQSLASEGFVAVIPNYRLYPKVKYPAFVQDGARAVAWTRANAQRYGGDPAKLFVMGHSAGAHIAAMLALDEDFLKAVNGSRTWLKGMIGLAGPYDFLPLTAPDLRDIFGPPDNYAVSQPINHVDGLNPPLLLMHAETDQDVWPKNTYNLAQAVKQQGGPVETVIYPELKCVLGTSPHACIVAVMSYSLKDKSDVLKQVTDFVKQHAADAPRASEQLHAVPLKAK